MLVLAFIQSSSRGELSVLICANTFMGAWVNSADSSSYVSAIGSFSNISTVLSVSIVVTGVSWCSLILSVSVVFGSSSSDTSSMIFVVSDSGTSLLLQFGESLGNFFLFPLGFFVVSLISSIRRIVTVPLPLISSNWVLWVLQPSCLGFLLDSDFSHVPIDLRVVVLEPR